MSPKTSHNNADSPSTTTEDFLRLVVDTIPALVVSARPNGSVDFINSGWREYMGLSREKLQGWGWNSAIHPEDLPKFVEEWDVAQAAGRPFENEARVRRLDGEYRWFLFRMVPLRDDSGTIVKWYGTGHDVEDLKLALDRIRQDERELRQLVDLVPVHIIVQRPDGSPFYTNRVACEYSGLAPGELREETHAHLERLSHPVESLFHPDDVERVRAARIRAVANGVPWESEARVLGKDGRYRSFLIRVYPLRDDKGEIIRWYATGTDIEDRKQAEDQLRKAYDEIKKLQEQLYKENLALKEEIDRSSMFEEIVGASPPLQAVLSRVSKVAPTESTVLITGETGTGKELIARAVHRRSARSAKAFVSVNCAAIPRSLLASELFGHEKGAFTGALQRRLGRFELADGGTIFLDEIGELPTETQIALLRVLQEREFERVGGNQSIKVDVRVIAATNRDLQAAIDAGSFRSDLYYRLNVFPIAIPPLRERKEDIPMLVAYFLDRYASKAGKEIRSMSRRTLERLISYPWPGNIRELQNVIERSVILCESENFSVDESWLSADAHPASRTQPLPQKLVSQEKEIIEAALVECKGRVSGADSGAIIVGASDSTGMGVPECFTNFGPRVNVRSWGDSIGSIGLGDDATLKANGNDNRQWYTRVFGGTSGASPIVTGVAALVQGTRAAVGLPKLNSIQMRSLLISTGVPQSTGVAIGPQPDLRAIITSFIPDEAMFVGQSTAPTTVTPKATFGVKVQFQNSGGAAWTGDHTMAVSTDSGNTVWQSSPFTLGSTASPVMPGDNVSENFSIMAPVATGTYTLAFEVRNNASQLAVSPPQTILVVAANTSFDNASLIVSAPSTLAANTSTTATVFATNTGTTTWNTGYSLSLSRINRISLPSNSVSIPGTVAPGQSVTLTFTIQCNGFGFSGFSAQMSGPSGSFGQSAGQTVSCQ